MRFLTVVAALLCLIVQYGAWSLAGPTPTIHIRNDTQLQDIVTWDEHSLFIHGERVMIMSAEFHPWRLPVPSLWLDVFQKIKALGFNCVSFYSNWALLEGKQGNFTAEGVFAYEPFFEAASKAGIYLLARPGPYINAEVSFGGYPGWLQRVDGHLRTADEGYLAATDNYAANMGAIIAKAQITNGGPVILYQPENEYTIGLTLPFPSGEYMQYVEDQARDAGVVVPFISNDAAPLGHNAPGSGLGEVDIYGHDAYPLGFDCSNPSTWPALALSGVYHSTHELQSPSTPFSLVEFQGGSYDPWGGAGFNSCASLTNEEFERVFYKNNYAAGATIHNIYMTFGGTNWGNIGHPGGYTSYDYGAAIAEDRTVAREKYSELKLQGEFLKVSPDYLVAEPGAAFIWTFANNAYITVTQLAGDTDAGRASFYVIRHSDYTRTASDDYTMTVPTSAGKITIPKLFDALTLNGRDSKFMVTDYPVGGYSLLYSTAEIFTHQQYDDHTILVVYTGPGEMNEMAVKVNGTVELDADDSIMVSNSSELVTLAWSTSATRRIVRLDDLTIHILDRNTAYTYWVPEVGSSAPVIVAGPYLVRSATIDGSTLSVTADFNTSTTLEVIGYPSDVTALSVNRAEVDFATQNGTMVSPIAYSAPALDLPTLRDLTWYAVDSLPELRPEYDDSRWVPANHTSTPNTKQRLRTPTSLFASDYGFHAGVLVFRGHFVAAGDERSFRLKTQGGSAYAHSAWLNGTFLGAFAGDAGTAGTGQTYDLPAALAAGAAYVLTVVVDQMGFDETIVVGLDAGKAPRGILEYDLLGSGAGGATTTEVAWKLAGNLGGEAAYADRARGPLNEGGLFAERRGYHLPAPPVSDASVFAAGASPLAALPGPGVTFFTARVPLDLPAAFDVPLAFVFGAVTGGGGGGSLRAQLYVNGWQFGKLVSHLGPQTRFPVPEGILDYGGDNWVGLLLWSVDGDGTRLTDFALEAGTPVRTGREPVVLVESPPWQEREGAF
ncbi:beta-galactosidase precursor [Xylariomycetidae sp. FL0641]|nr:beta-galactosidase precursor [Xylariomycetidae sp. FL0641]